MFKKQINQVTLIGLLHFNKQYIGRRFGKGGPLQHLIKLEQDIGNRLANPGTDTVLSALPILRFLPIPISLSFHKAKSVHQQILDALETLSVRFFCDLFQSIHL